MIPVLSGQMLARRGSRSWALGSWFVHVVVYVDVGWAASGLCPGVLGAGPGDERPAWAGASGGRGPMG